MAIPDIHGIYEDALKAEGLDATVQHYTQSNGMSDVFLVKKEIDGEELQYKQSISRQELESSSSPRQLLAHFAREAVHFFDEELTHRVEWGDRSVKFDIRDGYSATCLRCGTEVSMADLDRENTMIAETAVPNPTTNIDLDNIPDLKIRMTLLALLKRECDPMCTNSPHDGTYRKI